MTSLVSVYLELCAVLRGTLGEDKRIVGHYWFLFAFGVVNIVILN